MPEAAAGATALFVVFGYFVVEYLSSMPDRDPDPKLQSGSLRVPLRGDASSQSSLSWVW